VALAVSVAAVLVVPAIAAAVNFSMVRLVTSLA
jgi:hypothetical protein